MPPHGTDCTGFVYAVMSEGGVAARYSGGIPAAGITVEESYTPEIYRFDPGSMEFSVQMPIRNIRGLMDVLLGLVTPAAGRYIRSGKRQKEKNRRRKLKEGKHED